LPKPGTVRWGAGASRPTWPKTSRPRTRLAVTRPPIRPPVIRLATRWRTGRAIPARIDQPGTRLMTWRTAFRPMMAAPVTSRVMRWAVLRQAVPRLVTSRVVQLVVVRRALGFRVTRWTLRQAATSRLVRRRAIRRLVCGPVTSQIPRLAIMWATTQLVLPMRASPAPDTRPRVSLPATHARTRRRRIRPQGRKPVIQATLMRRPTRQRASRSTTGATASPPGIRRLTRDRPTRRPRTRTRTCGRRGPAVRSPRHIRPPGTGPVTPGVVGHPRTLVGVSSPRTQPRARRPAIRRETVGPPPTHPIRRLPWSFLTTVGRSPTHPSPGPPKRRWRPEAAAAPGPGRAREPAAS